VIAAHDSRMHRAFGMAHLLEHCAAVGRLTRPSAEPARSRVESALGAQLASRLVGGLARRGRAVAL
jgi:hypothetical protein